MAQFPCLTGTPGKKGLTGLEARSGETCSALLVGNKPKEISGMICP